VEHLRSVATTALPSALEHVADITAGSDRRLTVFLDYDGTLTPIVARPDDAHLAPHTRDLLRRLARRCTVAVISGRDLADVRGRVGLADIVYAGSHGFDIAGPRGLRWEHPDAHACLPALARAEKALREATHEIPGALVERKAYSLAVHFRNVHEARVQEVERQVNAVAAREPRLRQRLGKKVFDLVPDIDWDKGRAVLWLLQALAEDSGDTLPLYLGDDLTDEDAFAALRGRGVGIVVRDEARPTAASYALDSPVEVGSFLTRLLERSPRS
jgi:trehalose 6-phosphate phosphatase